MDENLMLTEKRKLVRAAEALRKNNIPAVCVATKEEAVKTVRSLLKSGCTVSCGGSATLKESGITELLRSGEYDFFDREKIPPAEAYLKTFSADAFLTSANAVTENGEIFNVDGNGNRVAAMIYGPKNVIVVAGKNKIVKSLDEAVYRLKTIAAPANGVRLSTQTPCARTGRCVCAREDGMTEGCSSTDRMCCQYVVIGYQRSKRITVVLVQEDLGY